MKRWDKKYHKKNYHSELFEAVITILIVIGGFILIYKIAANNHGGYMDRQTYCKKIKNHYCNDYELSKVEYEKKN